MQVSQMENATNGDLFRLHYTIRGWGKQSQIAALANELDKDARWKVIKADMPNDNKVVFDILIVKNPFPIALIVGAIGAIGTGLFLYLSLDKIEKISGGFGPVLVLGLFGAVLLIFMGKMK